MEDLLKYERLTAQILARSDKEIDFTASNKEIIFQHTQITNQRLIE